jgi:hypothetical protein
MECHAFEIPLFEVKKKKIFNFFKEKKKSGYICKECLQHVSSSRSLNYFLQSHLKLHPSKWTSYLRAVADEIVIHVPKSSGYDTLKLVTLLIDENEQEFSLRFPISRIERDFSSLTDMSNLDGFEGTLQKEYNSSCVGPYMGPYDQHKSLHLNCQLAASDLDYNQYTSFIHHEEFHCKTFSVKDSYEGLPALEQIDGLQVEGGAESIDQDANENGGEEEDEDAYRVFYTCQKKGCKIPCPCRPCCLEEEQCD